MTVYEWLYQIAETDEAYRVQVDLQARTLQFQNKPIILDGKHVGLQALRPDGEAVTFTGLVGNMDDAYVEIERLYAQFKRSVPGKSDKLDKGNFKAVSGDSLSYAELEENMPRQKARILLEGFILLAASAGVLTWKNPRHFFWRGTDPDLIIYREWVA